MDRTVRVMRDGRQAALRRRRMREWKNRRTHELLSAKPAETLASEAGSRLKLHPCTGSGLTAGAGSAQLR